MSLLQALCLFLSLGLSVMTLIVFHLKRRLRGSRELLSRVLNQQLYRTDEP